MRLEVLIDSEEPRIFPLKKDKITIGSSETCDIILPAEGISRKHLVVVNENDNYFVIDQGSSNGSFINEERLVPGRRVEFTSFFPVRLGSNVLITLLSDENDSTQSEAPFIPFPETKKEERPRQERKDEATKVLSLKDLQGAKTESLIKKRESLRQKKEATSNKKTIEKSKERSQTRFIQIIVVTILVIAGCYHYYTKQNETLEAVPAIKEKQVVETKNDVQEVKEKINTDLVETIDLVGVENFSSILGDIKCVGEIEEYLCEKLSFVKNEQFGVVQVGTTLHIVLNTSEYLESAKSFFNPRYFLTNTQSNEQREKFNYVFKQVNFVLYVVNKIPADLDFEKIKDRNITFWLYDSTNSSLLTTIAIKSTMLKKFKELISLKHLELLKLDRLETVSFFDQYFRTY